MVSTTWMYRKVALTLCTVTLLCTYYYYKDEQMENYKALKRIEDQLNTIQEVTSICNNNHSIRMYTNCLYIIIYVISIYLKLFSYVYLFIYTGYSTRLALKRLKSQRTEAKKIENSQ